MHRRRILQVVGAGLAAGTAGCLTADPESGDPSETPTAEGRPTTASSPSPSPSSPASRDSLRDPDLPLARADLRRAASWNAIPAITNPAFGSDWSGVEPTLGDEERVVGVEVDGDARAYPLAVLHWHEVVNDTFGGPLLVTYCPLCGSAVTAVRRVNEQETLFGVSGLLWNADLVLYDELTGSLWSQILAQAVRGPATGQTLTLRPSALMTWGQWRAAHPETAVLLPPPKSTTIRGEVVREYDGPTLGGPERVLGVASDGVARAYPKSAVEQAGVVNDRVGDLPVVVTVAGETLLAYVRRLDGRTLLFDRAGEWLTAGGSRWDPVTGRAIDGPHEGARLRRATDRSPMFLHAWQSFYPETTVYGR